MPSPVNRALFERLFTLDWSFVRRTVERYGVPARDADDIAQEVFSLALRRISDCDAARSARPWLFVIAVQYASNYRKLARHRVEPLASEDVEHAGPDTSAEEAVLANEEQALVRELIGRLRPKLREVLVLHDIEERPIAEIAAALGVPLKTAQARLALARKEAHRRGQAIAASERSLHVNVPAPLNSQRLCKVREIILAYGRPRRRASLAGFPASRRKAAPVRRYPMYGGRRESTSSESALAPPSGLVRPYEP